MERSEVTSDMDSAFIGFERQPDGRIRPPRMFSDETFDEQFWDTGAVTAPMLTNEAVVQFLGAMDHLHPRDNFDPSTLEDPRGTYHCTFLDPDHDYRRRADELIRSTFGPRLADAVPGYRVLTGNIYVKPPGTGRFEIHQNWPTLEDMDIPTLTAWIPLQDTGFHNGTIRLVPGGHRVFPDIAAATSDRFFDDFETQLIETHLRPIELAAGEALIFDDSLLHWSSDNMSDAPRITVQIEMVPADTSTVLWILDPDRPDEFQMWESNSEFYIDCEVEEVLHRPRRLRHLGNRPNPNRRITLSEYDETMGRADAIRQAKYVLS